MKDLDTKNFGLVIAFLLPGAIMLWGVSYSVSDVRAWLASTTGPTVGSFLTATVAALTLGMIANAVRWATLDQLHQYICGPSRPAFDWKGMSDPNKRAGFMEMNEQHYRYYQYYGSSFVALAVSWGLYEWNFGAAWDVRGALAALCTILFFAGRDAMCKYYERGGEALGLK